MTKVEMDYNSTLLQWDVFLVDYRGAGGDRYIAHVVGSGGLEWVACPPGSGKLWPTIVIPAALMHLLASELERHNILPAAHSGELEATRHHLADLRQIITAIYADPPHIPDG